MSSDLDSIIYLSETGSENPTESPTAPMTETAVTPGAPPPGAVPVSTDVVGMADVMIVGEGATP